MPPLGFVWAMPLLLRVVVKLLVPSLIQVYSEAVRSQGSVSVFLSVSSGFAAGQGLGPLAGAGAGYGGGYSLNLVSCVRDPVDDAVDLVGPLVDIRLQPVIARVRLNPPQQAQIPRPRDEVDERRRRVGVRAAHARDDVAQHVERIPCNGGDGPGEVEREAEGLDGDAQGLDGVSNAAYDAALVHGGFLGVFAVVEGSAVGEDVAVFVDLAMC